mmetsp:Transcript_9171/g.13761  ORF Transcript_9171/g.13761 Transcript_9171/m.13761 type:complete len:362 (+) Transcript_9171:37-1122(+)
MRAMGVNLLRAGKFRKFLHRGMCTKLRGGATTEQKETLIAIVCKEGHEVLKWKPDVSGVKFMVVEDEKALEGNPVAQEAEAVIWVPPVNASTLTTIWERLKNPKWIHSFFVGVDALAPFTAKHLINSDVPLTNARGAFSYSLAEYAMTSILYFNKEITRIQKNTADKNWEVFLMNVVKGKTLGLIGFGDINKHTARLAKAFGMKVIALRRSLNKSDDPEGLADEVYGYDDRLKVFAESDFVVSALPGTPETKDFIGAPELKAMKKTGVFINIGRGITVDEDALCKALDSKQIAGAALDVFKTEPLPESSPLWGRHNVLVTAHNADYVADYFEMGWKVWKDNFDAYKTNSPMTTLVEKKAGY